MKISFINNLHLGLLTCPQTPLALSGGNILNKNKVKV